MQKLSDIELEEMMKEADVDGDGLIDFNGGGEEGGERKGRGRRKGGGRVERRVEGKSGREG